MPAGTKVAKIDGTSLTLSIATNAPMNKATITFKPKPLEVIRKQALMTLSNQ